MKINTRAIDAYQRVAAVAQKPSVAGPSTVADTERRPSEAASVSISPEARALAKASEAPFDAQKVASLKQQVDAGTYKVDSNVVAQRLLDKLA